MSPERLSAEEKDLIKRSARAVMQLRMSLLDAADVYVRLGTGERGLEPDARVLAAGVVERVAELWREAELLGSWEVEREIGWEGPGEVLGALQDSLILSLSSHPDRRSEVLPTDETVARLEALEAEGAFEGLERMGDAEVDDGAPPRGKGLADRFDALADQLIVTSSQTFTFYLDVAPDGESLEARAVEALERLEAAASCNRALDAERVLVRQCGARRDLGPTREILRAMQNGLVLALSEDPVRRAKAMSAEELQRRIRPVYEGLKVPTESMSG